MRPEEIRIGTTYHIREWDDLAAEFGMWWVSGHRAVNTPVPLAETYRRICGKPFTVKRLERYGPGAHFGTVFCLSEEKTEVIEESVGMTRINIITPEMLEEIPLPEISPESLLDFLLG